MDFLELARSRYSCKKFDSRQISKEQLDSILEAGRLAPTAKNLQEQHVYVVQSAEGIAKIDTLTPCRYATQTNCHYADVWNPWAPRPLGLTCTVSVKKY